MIKRACTILLAFVTALSSCGSHQAERRAREDLLREHLNLTREVLDQYHSDRGIYPTSINELVHDGYLRNVPIDPITGRSDTWILVFEHPRPNPEPNARPRIYDIKSGAQGETLQGIPYGDL